MTLPHLISEKFGGSVWRGATKCVEEGILFIFTAESKIANFDPAYKLINLIKIITPNNLYPNAKGTHFQLNANKNWIISFLNYPLPFMSLWQICLECKWAIAETICAECGIIIISKQCFYRKSVLPPPHSASHCHGHKCTIHRRPHIPSPNKL